MKPIQILTNYPSDYDPDETEILVQAQIHSGEPRTWKYPGTNPYIEMLTVVDMATGTATDFYELPSWLQDEFRRRVEEVIREREIA